MSRVLRSWSTASHVGDTGAVPVTPPLRSWCDACLFFFGVIAIDVDVDVVIAIEVGVDAIRFIIVGERRAVGVVVGGGVGLQDEAWRRPSSGVG